jgi:mannose-6-phosphate isomerase-like protein (cupin superfamily)
MAFADITTTKKRAVGNGAEERVLVSPEDSTARRVRVSHLSIEPGATFRPEGHEAESIYFVISGRGTLAVSKVGSDWRSLLEAYTACWVPWNIQHSISNEGEDALRCLVLQARCAGEAPGWTELFDTVSAPRSIISTGSCRFFGGPGRTMRDVGSHHFTFFGCSDIFPHNELAAHVPMFGAEEIMYVLRGSGEISCGNETFAVKAGSLVYAPPETVHGIRNTGDSILRFAFGECLP